PAAVAFVRVVLLPVTLRSVLLAGVLHRDVLLELAHFQFLGCAVPLALLLALFLLGLLLLPLLRQALLLLLPALRFDEFGRHRGWLAAALAARRRRLPVQQHGEQQRGRGRDQAAEPQRAARRVPPRRALHGGRTGRAAGDAFDHRVGDVDARQRRAQRRPHG